MRYSESARCSFATTEAAIADDRESDAPEADNAFPYAEVTVLAAEDNAINKMVLQTFLEPLGFKLTFAENGKEAVDLFAKGCFDIVLMDIQMPVMDGEEALIEIRRLEELSGSEPVRSLPSPPARWIMKSPDMKKSGSIAMSPSRSAPKRSVRRFAAV